MQQLYGHCLPAPAWACRIWCCAGWLCWPRPRRRPGGLCSRIARVRNAFFALLLVNIVYFAWAHWIDVPQPVPVNPALAKLPTLKLVEEVPPSQRPQPTTSKVTQPASTACLSVGPFPDVANSAHAAALLKAKGFDPKQRAEQAQSSDGYWVYVGGFKTEADADHALVTLEHAGIKDALV